MTDYISLLPSHYQPILMTNTQIESICNDIPEPRGMGVNVRKIAHNEILKKIRTWLKSIKLVPNDDVFEQFKATCIESYYKSTIEPGTPVGVLSGISLGAPVTQMSLNTHRSAGAVSGTASAFTVMRDILSGSKMKRNIDMYVFLKHEQDYEPRWDGFIPSSGEKLNDVYHKGNDDYIYSLRKDWEQTTVYDLVGANTENREILNKRQAYEMGVSDLLDLFTIIRPEAFKDTGNSYPLNYVLMLKLDLYRMYSHEITMYDVAKAIEGPEPNDIVSCMWISQFDPRFFVVVNESKDLGKEMISKEMASITFFNEIIINKLNNFIIKGIPGIISIEPKKVEVTSIIDSIEVENDKSIIYSNHFLSRFLGPSLYDLYKLFSVAEFNATIDEENLSIIIDFKPYKEEGKQITLLDELNNRIEKVLNKSSENRTELEKLLLESKKFSYIKTFGYNFDSVLYMKDVDICRSYPTNSHEIYQYFGIDAARLYLIITFLNTLENSRAPYIDPKHYELHFDMLTNNGQISGLGFASANRRRVPIITAASHVRALDVFTNGCITGVKDPNTAITSSIATGQINKSNGTGRVEIIEDTENLPSHQSLAPQYNPFEDNNFNNVPEDEDEDLYATNETTTIEQIQPQIQTLPIQSQIQPSISSISPQIQPSISSQSKSTFATQIKPILSTQIKPTLPSQIKTTIPPQIKSTLSPQIKSTFSPQIKPTLPQQSATILTQSPQIQHQSPPTTAKSCSCASNIYLSIVCILRWSTISNRPRRKWHGKKVVSYRW